MVYKSISILLQNFDLGSNVLQCSDAILLRPSLRPLSRTSLSDGRIRSWADVM